MLSNRPVYGRTFHTAMWVIGMVAAAQLFAVIRAVMTRPGGAEIQRTDIVASLPPRPPQGMPPRTEIPKPAGISQDQGVPRSIPSTGNSIVSGEVEVPPVSTTQPSASAESLQISRDMKAARAPVSPDSSNPLPGPTFFGPSDTAGPSLSESLATAASDTKTIQDPILERLVSAGEELRAAGNMPGALQALREAESALPEHPRILGEMAATFSQMGLDEKATVYWDRILSLGAIRGGGYYELAARQLRGEQAPSSGATGQIMKIGEVKVTERPPDDAGQKVSLRIVVDADPANQLIGSDMSLLVYFYDIVDGEIIDPSTADTSYDYPTKEYDWLDGGKEEIVVGYQQPVFSEEESRELGVRRYYGYVIELYYQDRLQDRIEMPEELSRFRMEAPEEPALIAPENALFPETPNF
ncbi:MAG: hypothetical protein P1U58_05665 [Verrucomicrobiales bacterium]|nr:hypothetical protein [Verrucomicrobiales bacterium]